MPRVISLFYLLLSVYCSLAQAPALNWEKTFGGVLDDFGTSISQTADGKYIISGYTLSNNDLGSTNHGMTDAVCLSTDDNGAMYWSKCYGGSKEDIVYSIVPTKDGGYFMIGNTSSSDGDVSSCKGNTDIWVVKLFNDGKIDWQKSYGSTSLDQGNSAMQTADDGYILTGFAGFNDGDVINNHTADMWVVKLNFRGDIIWQKCLGGSSSEFGYSIKQTKDGGYVVAGSAISTNGDVSGMHGGSDFWVVKLNDTGAITWKKCYGGSAIDVAYSVSQTTDGGYILVGKTQSNNGDVIMNHGLYDVWVVKINDTGAIQWQKTYGGSSNDYANSIIQCAIGGYLIVGSTSSNDMDITINQGNRDLLIIKIDTTGKLEWQKTLGGQMDDVGGEAIETPDDGFIILGVTGSFGGDVSYSRGKRDIWLLKIGGIPISVSPLAGKSNNIKVYPTITNDVVNIELPRGYEKAGIRMVNTLGQEVPVVQNGSGLKRTVRMDNIPAVMYILYITNEGSTSSFKITYQQ